MKLIEQIKPAGFRAFFSGLSRPLKILFAIAAVIVATFVALFVINQLFIFVLAHSYVDELAEVFDLNHGITRAIVWTSFAVATILFGLVFSLTKWRRRVGLAGLLLLLIGHSLAIWWGTSGHVFDRSGKAMKCYVIAKDAVRYGVRPGVDPVTGRQCRPITPEMAERLNAYEKGNRPRRIDGGDPVFFDLVSGEAIVWYVRRNSGDIEIFDLMGFHPESGEELQPITRDVVESWKQQIARRVPQRVENPDQYGFFDPKTGKSRLWHRRTEGGGFEFYDSAGFHPRTGEPLVTVSREVIDAWQDFQSKNAAKRCYIITRDARTPVRYGDKPGLDPETGRQCREMTPEVVERLREYEKGNRPKRVVATEPTFFDLRTGEAITWYFRAKNGDVEIFDLMGFHPDSGEELLPITRDVVEQWKQQVARRVPQRIKNPDAYSFFDPITGESRVWYRRSERGEYEFFDSRGFHPSTGEPLSQVTREVITKWRQETEEAERKKKEDLAVREREARQRLEREETERRERAQREEADRRERVAQEMRQRQERQESEAREAAARSACDQLAGNPNDTNHVGPGVPYDVLKLQAGEARDACARAVSQFPNELRYQYQLGRALQFSDRNRAFEVHRKLAAANYPAAFDNLGWIYYGDKKNPNEAVNVFRRGVQLGDPDSMVSLAEMIDRGHYSPPDAAAEKLSLFQRAADRGHEGARRALEAELESRRRAEIQRANDLETQRRMLEIMGGMLQGVRR